MPFNHEDAQKLILYSRIHICTNKAFKKSYLTFKKQKNLSHGLTHAVFYHKITFVKSTTSKQKFKGVICYKSRFKTVLLKA